MATILGREALQQQVLMVTPVAVPELGGDMLMRQLSAADVARFAQANEQASADPNRRNVELTALLISMTWVDEEGNYILRSEDDAGVLLAQWPIALVNRLGEEAALVSGLVPTAAADAKKN